MKLEEMMLNVQPENVLSKEERKARLGGAEKKCYVDCKGGSWYVKSCDPYDIRPVCDNEPPGLCWCWPEN